MGKLRIYQSELERVYAGERGDEKRNQKTPEQSYLAQGLYNY
jgi:hypothetical protein